jgi:DNA processing protein
LPNSSQPHVAIVGTRRATANGLAIAKNLAKELASAGVAIVSGLALGIDAAAHQGALAAKGKTVAVLPVGLDRIYPEQNTALAEEILANDGGILSEYDPGTPSLKQHFLERNRIVSGLCVGVAIVEAPGKSGALSTASHALQQNREVFVVPGPINNTNYAGSHGLLRAGARLVTKAEEILDDLNLIKPENTVNPLALTWNSLDKNQQAVVSALREAGEPLNVDKIGDLTKIDISAVNRNLTMLLIRGIVKEESGRYYL